MTTLRIESERINHDDCEAFYCTDCRLTYSLSELTEREVELKNEGGGEFTAYCPECPTEAPRKMSNAGHLEEHKSADLDDVFAGSAWLDADGNCLNIFDNDGEYTVAVYPKPGLPDHSDMFSSDDRAAVEEWLAAKYTTLTPKWMD